MINKIMKELESKIDGNIIDFIRDYKKVEIDSYSLKGGSSYIFFGKHNILKNRVALKLYYFDSKVESHEEPQILREIENENIIKIYDANFINDNLAYYLIPEIKNGDIDIYLKTGL